jgi:hypothetical protein
MNISGLTVNGMNSMANNLFCDAGVAKFQPDDPRRNAERVAKISGPAGRYRFADCRDGARSRSLAFTVSSFARGTSGIETERAHAGHSKFPPT